MHEIAAALYGSVIEDSLYSLLMQNMKAVKKMVRNIFRNNEDQTALVNEMALIFEPDGHQAQEVINAAATASHMASCRSIRSGIAGGHCVLDPTCHTEQKIQNLSLVLSGNLW